MLHPSLVHGPSVVICAVMLAGCRPSTVDSAVTTCPAVAVSDDAPVTTSQPAGVDIPIDVHTTGAVVAVDLFYQQGSSEDWMLRAMSHTGAGTWAAVIPGADVDGDLMRYFVTAWDECEFQACSPATCDQDPQVFAVSP